MTFPLSKLTFRQCVVLVMMGVCNLTPALANTDTLPTDQTQETHLSSCYVEGFEDRMTCGYITQPLYANQTDGDTIDIHFVVIPAIKPSHPTEAVIGFAGGPGQGAIEYAGHFARTLRYVRETRDILLVDQRGTGRSNLLQCQPQLNIDSFSFDERTVDIIEYTKEEAKHCADTLQTDFSAYSTVHAAKDFEAVRQALGYEGFHLFGVSYGTRIAQEYTRQYPDSVITSMLDGVVPMQQSLANIGFAIDDALQFILDECTLSESCLRAHGNLEEKLAKLLVRLQAEPATVKMRHPRSNEVIDFVISESKLLSAIRLGMYRHSTRALIPLVISRAAENDFSTLMGFMSNTDIADSLALGMHNAIVCAEDWPILDDKVRSEMKDSYFGREMVKAFDLMCPYWNATPVDSDFYLPLNNEIPTLLLSGGLDPATPPGWGDLAMIELKNATHWVAPTATHGVVAQTCASKLIRQFVDQASTDNIDTSCLDRDTRQQFFLNVNGVVPAQPAMEE